MVEARRHVLPPTRLVPNSPYPLLHYPGFLSRECARSPNLAATKCFDLFAVNGWQIQWVFRYGSTQRSHYHSQAHECMVVLTGRARIRFGVADTVEDLEENTHGSGKEDGGIVIDAKAGDVFVLPAGLAHKTYSTSPQASFQLLTSGNGHSIDSQDIKGELAKVELSGFTMMGAYPASVTHWDFATGGEHVGKFEDVWAVPKPDRDPVLGDAEEGIATCW
ncbi:uncharacterized protein JN550_006970 [Neoarthrinium moseri]|uniref:uncharacterized protein n=1 Tax=Neoarthrinium moseri TaxID=1658444 RepID=UPI001FDE9C61|nr:uncharacterized protein JN550_006970 [Neoarthrinium moseri]KAI1867829.1 hypothetical protein JN550_006970 [Neoarthrinium moseri]